MEISKEIREQLVSEIQKYFANEREIDLGIIAAEGVLDFFIEVMGNKIYNAAVEDVKKFVSEKCENMVYDMDMLLK